MVWELPPPWDWLILAITIILVGGFVFWFSLANYHRRYFFDKALQLAVWRTLGWLVLYGGSFGLLFWIFSLIWPAGWLRYLVGSSVWWLLSETILAAIWKLLDRWLEVV